MIPYIYVCRTNLAVRECMRGKVCVCDDALDEVSNIWRSVVEEREGGKLGGLQYIFGKI